MKNWLKNNRLIMILAGVYLVSGFIFLPSFTEYFDKSYFENDEVDNVIKSFAFIVLVVNVYVFVSTLILLSITQDNGEAIFALFGFFYGFTKYLPWAYNMINERFNISDIKMNKK